MIVMPRRSGFTVLDHLHGRHFRAPRIIMMTASDEQRHRDFAQSRGVDAFLHKPFEMDNLLVKVDALLEA